MNTLAKYKHYRKAGANLINRIIESIDKDLIHEAISLLKMLTDQNTIVFEDEIEPHV